MNSHLFMHSHKGGFIIDLLIKPPLWECINKSDNYEINFKVGYKHYTSFIIQNVIFGPQWSKPFSNWSRYKAKPSLNTKWRHISMECFHFFEQRFPHICLNKVPIASVQHFILSILAYRHINFQQFPHFPIRTPIFHGESFGV